MPLELHWSGLHLLISGGQTGADQGGLLAAWRAGLETGGVAPANYKTSIGNCPLLEVFGLTAAGNFATRTKANVVGSDATVIIANNLSSVGSALTRREAKMSSKPFLDIGIGQLVLDFEGDAGGTSKFIDDIQAQGKALANFTHKHQVQVLNVAGNRELNMQKQPITLISSWIVGAALEILRCDGKLICKT